MNDLLLGVLSVIGLFALYWALIGQWKHNKVMREAELKRMEKETKEKGLFPKREGEKEGEEEGHPPASEGEAKKK